jgi:hypothetical protein
MKRLATQMKRRWGDRKFAKSNLPSIQLEVEDVYVQFTGTALAAQMNRKKPGRLVSRLFQRVTKLFFSHSDELVALNANRCTAQNGGGVPWVQV